MCLSLTATASSSLWMRGNVGPPLRASWHGVSASGLDSKLECPYTWNACPPVISSPESNATLAEAHLDPKHSPFRPEIDNQASAQWRYFTEFTAKAIIHVEQYRLRAGRQGADWSLLFLYPLFLSLCDLSLSLSPSLQVERERERLVPESFVFPNLVQNFYICSLRVRCFLSFFII